MQDHCGDREVYRDRTGVDNRRDQRRGHQCGIEFQTRREQRHHRADEFGDDDGKHERQGNHEGNHGIAVHDEDSHGVDRRQHRADQNGYPKLLKNNPEHIRYMQLVQSETANDQRRRLRTAVAAGIHEHRNK